MSKTLVTELLKKLDREMMAKKILSELISYVNLKDSVDTVMKHFIRVTDCEAIQIRLYVDNKPYFHAQYGFPHAHVFNDPFVCSENSEYKCFRIPDYEVWTTRCLCCDVINGNVDRDMPFFTSQGSFWTNDFLDIANKSGRNCMCLKTKSVAMLRISFGNNLVGFVQLFSNQTPLSLDKIFYLEMIVSHIGAVFYNNLVYTRMKEAYEALNTGLTPICSGCKKVNQEGEEWENIEDYLFKRVGAEFTHTICPECMEKLYPVVFARIKEKNED